MKVTRFEFEFTHAARKFVASCQSYKIPKFHNYPLYRVSVTRDKENHDTYIFYKVDWEDRQFFWFELPGMKESIAKSIDKALRRHLGN